MVSPCSQLSFEFCGQVENGFKGNSFPVIIADDSICRELSVLESDFEEDVQTPDVIPEEEVHNSVLPRSREDALHFLNELGWLFQRTQAPCSPLFTDFSSTRFKYLLTFSVEQDWCALIKTLLDILVERSLRDDTIKQESLKTLSEVKLLSRAVKRKCRKMVDLLLHYCVSHGQDVTKAYLFTPNMAGPGGITPLHMAASMQDSEDMVDALTNDPQEIGLKCWDSLLDDNDQSPFMYAMLRNNLSYNRLVERKLADRANGQVTIQVEGGEISTDGSWVGGSNTHRAQNSQPSCARCALVGTARLRRNARSKGLLQRPYVHSLLAIAAVCVCVCVLFRGAPQIGSIEPFKWENLEQEKLEMSGLVKKSFLTSEALEKAGTRRQIRVGQEADRSWVGERWFPQASKAEEEKLNGLWELTLPVLGRIP
ncbi:hypothetical protein B296_00022571 [Ensete ventricosum]|uniref:Uncharacterized protein n=1 Tax=Ensete ventricosum TaxID=4639 RepID=A0A427AXX1_ENSVE|nr:hypothetical protein B296_00022571 [Ensete ventricosum]